MKDKLRMMIVSVVLVSVVGFLAGCQSTGRKHETLPMIRITLMAMRKKGDSDLSVVHAIVIETMLSICDPDFDLDFDSSRCQGED